MNSAKRLPLGIKLAYLGLMLVVLPTCIYVPTHLLLGRIFRQTSDTSLWLT